MKTTLWTLIIRLIVSIGNAILKVIGGKDANP